MTIKRKLKEEKEQVCFASLEKFDSFCMTKCSIIYNSIQFTSLYDTR